MDGVSPPHAAGHPAARPAGSSGVPSDGTSPPGEAEAPEPQWAGPGVVVALGTTDGRYRLGTARAVSWGAGEDGPAAAATLARLLAHYGLWLGFGGEAAALHPGRLRHCPGPAGEAGRVEYRVEVRGISRRAQRLTADGAVLMEGRAVTVVEGLSIAFRPAALPAGEGVSPAAPPAA